MRIIKRIIFPILLVIVFIISNYTPAPIFAQQIGDTTLITYGTRQLQWEGGNEHRMTPDGRYIVFLSGYYAGPEKTQVFLYDRVANTTELVSVNANGDVANWNTYDVDISDDGQIIAYSTYAYNLGATDTNERTDIYVLNRQNGQTTRVSVDSAGNQANNQSTAVFISGNGRFVTFSSDATNLIGTDTNGLTDVYVHDRQTGQTTRVSVDSAGVQSNAASEVKGISNDGRYVLFESTASNLVANDTNAVSDVFVHDRQTAQTIRVSVSAAGVQGNAESFNPSISGDGQRVVFLSEANTLVGNDTNFTADIFLRDLSTNTVSFVNVNNGGGLSSTSGSHIVYPTISNNGRYVTFTWNANNLVAGDTDYDYDVFVRDTQTNTNRLVSLTSAGVQTPYSNDTWYEGTFTSDDGRFVSFGALVNDFVPADTNDKLDIFVRDTQANTTTSVTVGNTSVAIDGALGDALYPNVSGNGRYVAFASKSPTLNPNGSTACFLFIYDHQTGTTTLVSVNDAGQPHYIHPTTCWGMYLSDDGRYLTFITTEPFVTGDNANSYDIFVRDLQLGTTTRVGLMPLGTPFPSGGFAISGDARYIVFGSTNSTLVANDTNNKSDVFVYDTQTTQITRVSVDSAGNQANEVNSLYDISSDARYILFRSFANNLVPNAANQGVYLHDRQTGQTIAASVDSAGNPKSGSSGRISDDGRFILFSSTDSTIVPNDTNGVEDLFINDRQTGLVRRVSVSSFGVQGNKKSWGYGLSLSSDGTLIFFHSDATNLVPNDVNNLTDLFVHNRLTGQTTLLAQGTYYNPSLPLRPEDFSYSISDDGYTLAFSTANTGFDPRDINYMNDVFIRELIPNVVLDTPTLITPADTGLVNPPVEFSWNAVNGATDYRLQIATDNLFFDIKLDKPLTTTTYSLNGLTSGTYYWRVIAYNATLTSLWSAPRQFTQETNPPQLVPPTLIAPVDMANLESVTPNFTFSWDAINGATSYQIQVSRDETFNTDVQINQTVTPANFVTNTLNYTFYTPDTYYWRVRTIADGFYGEWSVVNEFTLLNYPPVVLVSPENNVVTHVARVVFNWRFTLPGGSQLQVARDPDFMDIVDDIRLQLPSSARYYNPGVYYWRVRLTLAGDIFSLWSEMRQFTIVPLPTPTLINPEDNGSVYGVSATLNWSEVQNGYGANHRYRIQIATDSQMTNIVINATNTFSHPLIPPSYSFQTGTQNTPYYWRVQSIHDSSYFVGDPGEWSETRQFTIRPYLPPTLLSPENGATVKTPLINFTWDSPLIGMVSRIQVARDDQFTQMVTNSALTPGREDFSIEPRLTGGGTYYWRVRLENGDWSETRQVITVAPIQFILPAQGTLFLNPTITFSWEEAIGLLYRLTCYRDANLTQFVFRNTLSQTSYTWTFPTTPMTYYCTVQLSSGNYYSLTSDVLTFSIINATYDEAHTLNEQQLFNMAQPHLTSDMSFALFDITPTGILTTIQFDDGAVVTANVLFAVQNGLITITIEDVLGGSVDQQSAFYQDVSALFMTVFTEALPDDYVSLKTFSMTDMGITIAVVRPTQIP